MDSIALIENNRAYTHSDAALEIARNLDGYYRHMYIFRFIPKVLRDAIYRFIAKYRYKVFGKKDSCMMPSNELKDRFLD
jgi:predicted DCC family thiol-disulfide oxidoreductase YuxK